MELRIKEVAKLRGLQLKDIAEKMGIARESLTRTINGNPTLDTLTKIAEAMEVDIIELFPQPNQSHVTGYLEYLGEVIKINNNNDLLRLVDRIQSIEE